MNIKLISKRLQLRWLPTIAIFVCLVCSCQMNIGWADVSSDIALITQSAESGDAKAQNALGGLYEFGAVGLPQSNDNAVYWYRKSATQGYSKAQFNLGQMYVDGVGVPKDVKEGVQWIRKAAEQGFAPAQYNIGARYHLGPRYYS